LGESDTNGQPFISVFLLDRCMASVYYKRTLQAGDVSGAFYEARGTIKFDISNRRAGKKRRI
jgi:hypothetical protein